MPRRRATRPDDKRLKSNMPEERRAAPRVKSRYQQLIDGDLTVADLDDDEIQQGRCKDKNGRFAGRPPKTFPRELHDAMRNEYMKRMQEKLNVYGDVAVLTLLDVMNNRMAAAPARVRAAEVMLERVMGKVPDKVNQTIEIKKFEEGIGDLLVDIDETAGGDNVTPITKGKKAG